MVHYIIIREIKCGTFIERLGADLEHHMAVLTLPYNPSLAVDHLTSIEHKTSGYT